MFLCCKKICFTQFSDLTSPPWFTYWKTIYSALFCCLVSDTSSTVMPFKGETNIIFVHKSAVFTSSSGQLTSWVRDRLKMRTRTVGEPHSCVLFPYKAVPITADASDSVTFFFRCTESLAPERESRPVYPSKTTWQVMLAWQSLFPSLYHRLFTSAFLRDKSEALLIATIVVPFLWACECHLICFLEIGY